MPRLECSVKLNENEKLTISSDNILPNRHQTSTSNQITSQNQPSTSIPSLTTFHSTTHPSPFHQQDPKIKIPISKNNPPTPKKTLNNGNLTQPQRIWSSRSHHHNHRHQQQRHSGRSRHPTWRASRFGKFLSTKFIRCIEETIASWQMAKKTFSCCQPLPRVLRQLQVSLTIYQKRNSIPSWCCVLIFFMR